MQKTDNPRKALGKGLGALLPTRPPAPQSNPIEPQAAPETVAIDLIDPNPLQPRHHFQQERLTELAQSIRENGIIQPLVVRHAGARYQLVAGERRWRAAKLAGIERVPVVVRQIADDRLLEITLIENIQREDLNPIETAHAFARLGQELNLDADTIGRRTGKDRSTIINFLRLLQLPADVQQLVMEAKLSASAARCICALPNAELQRAVAGKMMAEDWPVRKVERAVQKMLEGRGLKPAEEIGTDPNVKAAIQELERVLGTRVRIVEKAKQKGRIEIDYYSSEDLDRIYSLIVKEE
jgi:ParB family chromosome partitioning protein